MDQKMESAAAAPIVTADIYDAHHEQLQVCSLQFRSFGQIESFCGPCSTVAAFEDHGPVLEALEKEGKGRVLIADGGGSLRIGILGDKLAGIGVNNGWMGIIVVGAIRDSRGIDELNIGVKALGVTARRTWSVGSGRHDVPLQFGSITVQPGDWVYADRDCVLVGAGQRDVREALQIGNAD
jgi:regulator of ribonuclease activity A